MKKILIGLTMLGLVGCAGGVGVQSVSVPNVQEISYKNIISCKKVDENFSDCKITDGGFSVVIRIQTSEIPTAPESEVK